MSRIQKAQNDLKVILEAGYELLEKQGVYSTPEVKTFEEYVRQGLGLNLYNSWFKSLENKFKDNKLNFKRFRSKTESNNSNSNSPAVLFKHQLKELDEIVNNLEYFESYKITPSHAVVEFKDGVIIQGYKSHKFKYDVYRNLLKLLWEGRRIITPDNKLLKQESLLQRDHVYNQLNINHERFKDIVRSTQIEMRRKSIDLNIRFPDSVFIEVVQDSM
jgi:hypothetical protein